MSDFSARPARPSDLEALLSLQARWPSLPQWSREGFQAELGKTLFVLEEDGAVCAYASLLFLPPEAQLRMIAVAPDRARRGLGRALLEHLKEAARASGCAKLTLEVSAGNSAGSAFYGVAGFRVVGRRPKFYNDGSDAILMDLDLA